MGSNPVPVPAQRELSGTPPGGVYGSSPRTRDNTRDSTPTNNATAARKFFKRLQYDPSLEATQFSVGILETREQAERKSGAEAWSLRLHSSLTELGFTDFVARFEKEGEDIPFHRIVWFKQNGVIVWEAENLKAKLVGSEGSHYSHSHHHSHSSQLPPAPVLVGGSFTGCSPPAGSFMARLAAGAAAASSSTTPPPAGLPPRSASLTPEYTASSSHSTHSQQAQQWKPQRHSATDYTGSPRSWGGPGHWSAAAAAGGGLSGTACHSQSPAGHSPLLGTSPLGCCALSAGHSSASYPYGTSPKTFSGSWTATAGSFTTAHATDGGILGGSSYKGHVTPSPCGSCNSSYTATSALAAAVAAGGPVSHRPSTAGTSTSAVSADTGTGPWPLGHVELSTNAVGEAVSQELQHLAGVTAPEELADYSQLPEECWVEIMQRLGVKELCYISRVSRALRTLASRAFLWSSAYERLFGAPPPTDWSGQTVKRLCRRSELRASRWLEAEIEGRSCGFSGTWCCQLDDAKVLSGDGCCVRLWSHDTGRRIATLRGHTGRVTAVAYDDELIISGCSQGIVKLWSMDELKLSKTLRHHTDAITATALLHGLPISASKDGTVCVWDAAAPNSPLVVLEHGAPVHAVQLQEEKGQLISSSNTLGVWDMNTAQLLFNLNAPAGLTRLSSGASSSSSLSTAGGAAPGAAAGSSAGNAAAGAAAVGGGVGRLDADDADGDLLHDGWLLDDDDDDDDSNSEEGDALDAADVAAGAAGTTADSKPFTCVSSHGNIVAAGRAGSVVLWDLRSQDAVGVIKPAAFANPKPFNSPCVGVQLDDWKLVTGWAGSGGGSRGGSSSCWWRSSSDITDMPVGNSLEVYDIRATSSHSGLDTGAPNSSSAATASSAGVWSAELVMSLPLPNRVTCFQFYGQKLLVGQEGAECCLMSFNPPGSSTARAAAAWGFGSNNHTSGYGSAGAACYGMSPGAPGAYAGYEDGGNVGEAGGSRGGKGKKKGATKVPPKKQTRYPKRATR